MAASARGRLSKKASFWSSHIEAWHRSGLGQGAYCRQHGLSQSSLSYWRTRLAKGSEKATVPSVTIVPVPLPVSSQAVVVGVTAPNGNLCTLAQRTTLRPLHNSRKPLFTPISGS